MPIQKWSRIATVLLMLSLCMPGESVACSSPPRASVEKEAESASAIFLAKLVSTKRIPVPDDESGQLFTEVATFLVLEAWKGDHSPGDTVVFQSILSGSGSCVVSAINDPQWIEDVSGAEVKFSGIWLIYAFGQEPYGLSGTGRNTPLEYGGAEDLQTLYRLFVPLQSRHKTKASG